MGNMEHIRKMYNVPAKRGGRIRFEKRNTGTIVAARYGRLRVRFDGEKRSVFLHPTWEVEYLPNTSGAIFSPDDIRKVRECIGLLNCMILSGEKYSNTSRHAVMEALKIIERIEANKA